MNHPQISINTERLLIDDIIDKQSQEDAPRLLHYIINSLQKGKFDLSVVTIIETLNKPINDYQNLSPHVIAAKKARDRGREVGRGSIIRYVVVKGKGPISQRTEPVEDVDNWMMIDTDYYINNHIMPAYDNLLLATQLNKGWSEWYPYYLKTIHWQNLRYQALKNAKWKCQLCGHQTTELEVHHNNYKSLFYESLSDLVVLCHHHHELITKDLKGVVCAEEGGD